MSINTNSVSDTTDYQGLIDPLDDNAMIIAIKNFAKRNNVAIMIRPDIVHGENDIDLDINKIVNDNFWDIV